MDKKILVITAVIILVIVGAMILWPQRNNKTEISRPIAVVKTSLGEIQIELFEDLTPQTVSNFIALAETGFYNGVLFHRVIPEFIIQAGDPLTKERPDDKNIHGTGGPGYTIPDEFVDTLSNVKGTISMANAGPNTGGSQFFFNLSDNTFLDFDKLPQESQHAVFGRIIEGYEVVKAISLVRRDSGDYPLEPVIIESLKINRP
jgi:peptidylprolyl isomerase